MTEEKIVDLSKNFAIEIINLCREIRENRNEKILVNQLLRSGTSIGANVHEANYASSRADFINKLQIALKECYETEYWLEIFQKTGYIELEEYKKFYADCSKIRKKISSVYHNSKTEFINIATTNLWRSQQFNSLSEAKIHADACRQFTKGRAFQFTKK